MLQADVLRHLKTLHREIESDAGKDPAMVTDDVCPVGGLAGFDSPLIPNMIRGVGKAVGLQFPKGQRLRNCYVDPKGKVLSLRDVAKRFCELYGR